MTFVAKWQRSWYLGGTNMHSAPSPEPTATMTATRLARLRLRVARGVSTVVSLAVIVAMGYARRQEEEKGDHEQVDDDTSQIYFDHWKPSAQVDSRPRARQYLLASS